MRSFSLLVALVVGVAPVAAAQRGGGATTQAQQGSACIWGCSTLTNQWGETTGYACRQGASGYQGSDCGASVYGCVLWTMGCTNLGMMDASGQVLLVVRTCERADPEESQRAALGARPGRSKET